jgi:hypothetical protein
MDVRKVTISEATIDRIRMSSGKKKVQLREEAIKNLIKSKPAGTVLKVKDFQKVTLVENAGTVHAILKRLLVRGDIDRFRPNPLKKIQFAYTVMDEVKVKTPPVIRARDMNPITFSHEDIERKAQEFLWEVDDVDRPTLKKFLDFFVNGGGVK